MLVSVAHNIQLFTHALPSITIICVYRKKFQNTGQSGNTGHLYFFISMIWVAVAQANVLVAYVSSGELSVYFAMC